MVNLTIRLSKSRTNSGLKPQHKLLEAIQAPFASDFLNTNLPLVKGIGFLFPETCRRKFVGAKVRPKPGGKVRICLMCNFPIAIYGRLDPCHHVFCFACAKSNSSCFMCKRKVIQVEKVDVLVGIFICGMPGCLRSFLVKPDFELHIANDHSQPHQLESPKGGSCGNPISFQSPTQHFAQEQTQQQSSSDLQSNIPRVDNFREEKLQRRRTNWELSKQGHKLREHINDHVLQVGTKKGDLTNDLGQKKRDRERGGHAHKSFQPPSKQSCRQQQVMTLPTPPPYTLPNYPPLFSSLNEPKIQPFQLYSGIGMQPRPEHLDATVPLQHAGPKVGFPRGDPWPLNFVLQEGFGANGCPKRPMQGVVQDGFPLIQSNPRPLFFPDHGLHMGMPHISMPRFHEGHLPRPPGPLPKQSVFSRMRPSIGPNLGELIVDYGWRPGSIGKFGGPRGGHVLPG